MSLTYDLPKMQIQAQLHQWLLVCETKDLCGVQKDLFMFVL